ncbi:MAG: peroxidase-related enzyme [Acidobacteriota bacterium]|nr:peroxidase-related enzyme [Acidobacteriota bacterium]
MPESQGLAEPQRRTTIHATNLPLVAEANAPDEVQQLYAHFRATFDRKDVPGILQCFATHPALLEHMMGLAETMLFSAGALGRANKEMLATFVSSQNHCAYCADSHGFFLRMSGGSTELLTAAAACDLQSTSLTSAQRALLQFVQKITNDSSGISPQDVQPLRDLGWTELQIAEAVHLTALFACFNRVANAFGLPSQGLLAMDSALDSNPGEHP